MVDGLPDPSDEHLELVGGPGGLGHCDVDQGASG
jgi:hypothetical protein